jgi:DNA mismatch repair protein MLH3
MLIYRFVQLPVRRKSHTSPTRTIEYVRRELETYALMFPNVSFSLENTHRADSKTVEAYVLRIPKAELFSATFLS